MCVDHVCFDSCFSSRNSHKLKIFCFGCCNAFNAKCFDVKITKFVDLISSESKDSNIVFLCKKCHLKLSKLKNKSRTSLDAVHRRSTAPSLDRVPEAQIKPNDNVSIDSPLSSSTLNHNLLTTINDKLRQIIHDNNELHKRIDTSTHTPQIPLNVNANDHAPTLHSPPVESPSIKRTDNSALSDVINMNEMRHVK